MKLKLLLILGTCVFMQLNSQTDWTLLNPKPSSKFHRAIFFTSQSHGFIVNEEELLYTIDAGENWNIKQGIAGGNDIKFYGDIGFIVGEYGHISRSVNEGNSWQNLNANTEEHLNTVHILNSNTIFITGETKLLKSFDGGQNWDIFDIPDFSVRKSFFINEQMGHIACKDGEILKTIDGGNNWYITETISTSPSDFESIYFVNENVGFASRQHDSFLRTEDGGETWEDISTPLDGLYSVFFFVDDNTGFAAGEYGLIKKTIDGGVTWEYVPFQSGLVGSSTISGIFFLNENIGFAAGLRGRILKTIDGGENWTPYSPTYNDIFRLTFPSNQVGFAAINNALLKTTNSGNNWNYIGEIEENKKLGSFVFIDEQLGYAIGGGTQGISEPNNFVYKTMDGGISWIKTNQGEPLGQYFSLFDINFINENIGFASSNNYNYPGFYRTLNGGNSWEKLGEERFSKIQFIDAQIGFALRPNGSFSDMFKTTDGGNNWAQITNDGGSSINDFQFFDEHHGYIAGSGQLKYTSDSGQTWEEINKPEPWIYIDLIKFQSRDFGYIKGNIGKLYKTENGGQTWENVFTSNDIFDIEFTDIGDVYLCGTFGRIHKAFSGLVNNEGLVKNTQRLNIYPNPTQNSFYIKLDSFQSTLGKIIITDFSGRVVYESNKEFFDNSAKKLNVSNLPNGIFWVSLKTEKYIISQKLVVNNTDE
jgi:photosystem II stability/assembly factor-like uncharacterized protein